MDTDQYLKGMRDCKAGVPHKDGSEDYNKGYATQFEMQEALSAGCFN